MTHGFVRHPSGLFRIATLFCIATLCFALFGCTGAVSDAGGVSSPDPRNPDAPQQPPDLPDDRPIRTYSCDEDAAYEAPAVRVSANRIKNLLTGFPVTTEEAQALEANPDLLRSYIDTWLDTEEGQEKLERFLLHAFQQDRYTPTMMDDFMGYNLVGGTLESGASVRGLMNRSWKESFGKTAMQFFNEGRPLTELFTTRSYVMTTAQLVTLALADDIQLGIYQETPVIRQLGVHGQRVDEAGVVYTRDAIPVSQSLDPDHANFMRFTVPEGALICDDASEFVDPPGRGEKLVRNAIETMFGAYRKCAPYSHSRSRPQLEESDFSDWRLVNIRQPLAGESTHAFYDVDQLRDNSEIVLHGRYVGFFTTPAFLAGWPTNDDNQARLTANQTLIVALGASIDPDEDVIPLSVEALSADHSDPETACWSCHVRLDPMRQFFRRDFDNLYHRQTDEAILSEQPSFAFLGVNAEGENLYDLGDILAEHPAAPGAWAQKLCFYATSSACPEDHPEFQTVLDGFREQGGTLRALIRQLYSSPLITGLSCVEGGSGNVPTIQRRGHFCASLSNRTGIDDICFDDPTTARSPVRDVVGLVVEAIPEDSINRGGATPNTPADATLFTSQATRLACHSFANSHPSSLETFVNVSDSEGAADSIDKIVRELAGVADDDPQHDGIRALFHDHYAEVVEVATPSLGGTLASQFALRSVLKMACESPLFAGQGL